MSVDVAWFPDYGHLMAGIFVIVENKWTDLGIKAPIRSLRIKLVQPLNFFHLWVVANILFWVDQPGPK